MCDGTENSRQTASASQTTHLAWAGGVRPTWDERIGAKIRRIYADMLKHGETCRTCPLPGVHCETAETLRQAYAHAEAAR